MVLFQELCHELCKRLHFDVAELPLRHTQLDRLDSCNSPLMPRGAVFHSCNSPLTPRAVAMAAVL